jgi:glutamate synthase (NADPH/NADH) small chain
MHLGVADSSGRQVPQPLPGSHFMLPADLAILALGFDPEEVPRLFGAPELALRPDGTIKIDFRSMMTSLDGVFAAGDIVRGASLVVWAIRDGRDAAEQIHRYVQQKAAAVVAAAE